MTRLVPSQRGGYLLQHEDNLFHLHSSNKERTRKYWICSLKQVCNARCITNHDTQNEITVYKCGEHSHEDRKVDTQVREVMRGIKRRAEENPNQPPNAIFREATETIDDEEIILNLPERNSVLRRINRVQNRNRPQNPRDLEDLEILPPYNRTLNDEVFLQYDSGMDDPDRIVIFYTIRCLTYLCNSRKKFADGTFKTVPDIFYQLYTIHGVIFDSVFPLIYCITNKKDQNTYVRIFEHLKQAALDNNKELNPQYFVTDFELASMNAINQVFPGTSCQGCLFHFSQSLWKHAVVSCGLKASYSNNQEIRSGVQELMALPFVPIDDVEEVFDIVYNELHDDVIPLAEYLKATYVRGRPARGRRRAVPPRFSPPKWNVYDCVRTGGHRTNNVVEGWHSRFQKLIFTHHASVWKFIEHIKKDQRANEVLIAQLGAGHKIKHPISKKYVNNQRQIEATVARYEEHKENNDIRRYLRSISCRLKLNSREVVQEEEDSSDSD